MSLLRKALEGDLTDRTTEEAVINPVEPAVVKQPEDVIMSGPLGQIYTQALNIAFAKPQTDDVENGKEEALTVSETVATESQANDAIMTANAINIVSNTNDNDVNPDALIYGVSAQKVDESTIVDVASQMSQYELDQPEEFIVVIDATHMATNTDAGIDPTNNDQNAEVYLTRPATDADILNSPLIPVLESMVVRMGGRVVYSLRQAIECLDALEPVVMDIEDELDPEDGTPAKKEDASEIGTEEVDGDKAPKEKPLEVVEAIATVEEEAAGVALESEKKKKDDKKKEVKFEKTSSKLIRAAAKINGIMDQIKETKVRAELHHAVGIIMSAKKDILFAKGKKSFLE